MVVRRLSLPSHESPGRRKKLVLWRLLILVLYLGSGTVAAQGPSEQEVLGVRIGATVAEVTVPANGDVRIVTVERFAGQDVVIVVRGEFVYSQRPGYPLGRQDAKYRWGSRHPAKVCLPCTDPGNEGLAFVIDGKYREPTREDFDTHTYVYVYRVQASGVLTFQIRDDNYADNFGALRVTVYEKA
jgi:hypothetical protein